MVRAHRQAWCWQDEYYGLTMEDIRELERKTQLALQEKMAHIEEEAMNGNAPKKEISLPTQESVSTSGVPPTEKAAVEEEEEKKMKKEGKTISHVNSKSSMSSLGASRKQSWGSARSHKSIAGGERCLLRSNKKCHLLQNGFHDHDLSGERFLVDCGWKLQW